MSAHWLAIFLALAPAQPQEPPAPPSAPAVAPAPDAKPEPRPAPPERQPGAPSETAPDNGIPASIAPFRSRLEALSPSSPETYFLLGEEVADQANDSATRDLAKQLYVLAFDLSTDRPGRASLQAACCVALADLVRADHDRRWLVALARTLDPRRVPPEWLARQPPATTDSAAYQVATLVGLVRTGQGGTARQLLERPEVKAALDSYDRLMNNMGVWNGAAGLIREAGRWPCQECQNERIVKRGNPPEARLCPNCNGEPGPEMSGNQLIAQLRFESLILQGTQRSWAAQVAADGGAPLVDPEAGGLAAAFDVDPSLVLWRDGRWVADPSMPARPKPAPAPPAPQEQPPKAPTDAPSPPPGTPASG
jgi:hypothetical protein